MRQSMHYLLLPELITFRGLGSYSSPFVSMSFLFVSIQTAQFKVLMNKTVPRTYLLSNQLKKEIILADLITAMYTLRGHNRFGFLVETHN